MDLPALPGPARDAAILNAIRAGNYEVSWGTVSSTAGSHQALFRVFADALKIDGVRVTTSAFLEQVIADLLGCSLLTAKLSDLLYAQRAWTLLPRTQPATNQMVTTAAMIAQSAWIDQQLAAQNYSGTGIVSTVGKAWILDNLFVTNPAVAGKAINYGWYLPSNSFLGQTWPKSVTLPNAWVIQGRGWAHAPQEVDYSQNCVLIARDCIVDGVQRDLHDILQDPVLSYLANADGVLRVIRQPGVPLGPPLPRPPPCLGPDCPTNVLWTPTAPAGSLSSLAPVALVMGLAGFLGGLALDSRGRL